MALRCHFMLKSVFFVGLIRFTCLVSGDNYVKTNEDAPKLSATNVRQGLQFTAM